MTSFIDLMANDVWTEADIVNRTEAIIAGAFPNVEILKRKVTGMMLGQYLLTPDEQAQFGAYAALSFDAGALADAARADMALLGDAMAVEAARQGLAVDPDDKAAQAVLAGARPEVLALVLQREPPPPQPVIEPGFVAASQI